MSIKSGAIHLERNFYGFTVVRVAKPTGGAANRRQVAAHGEPRKRRKRRLMLFLNLRKTAIRVKWGEWICIINMDVVTAALAPA